MQFQEKSGQTLAEPVSVSDFKSYIGYTGSDQDVLIAKMIKAIRRWVERYTGKCAVEKIYQAQFNEYDRLDGKFTLPIGPVKEVASVKINNVDTEYELSGLTESEILINGYVQYPVTVEYTASVSDCVENLELAILRLTANLFKNKRDVSEVNTQKVDFTTKQLLNAL